MKLSIVDVSMNRFVSIYGWPVLSLFLISLLPPTLSFFEKDLSLRMAHSLYHWMTLWLIVLAGVLYMEAYSAATHTSE
jgi:hypothetical protein